MAVMESQLRDLLSVSGPFGVNLGNGRILSQSIHGLRYFLDANDIMITPILITNRQWEPEVTRIVWDLCRPGGVFVDVGAGIGYFSCLAARRVGRTGRVVCFEADPQSYRLLVDNINVNWFFEGVEAHNRAVFDHNGSLTLYRRLRYQANTSVARISDDELERIFDRTEAVEVPSVTLDAMFATDNRTIDVLKIDVEGAEPYVFDGMRKTVEANPDMIVLAEWSPNQITRAGRSPEDFVKSIREFGYRIQLIGDTLQPLQPGDLYGYSHGMLLLDHP